MLPDSNIARSFPRVAGTFSTSTPVALVKGSKMVLTTASSYAPPIVRTTIRPAPPACRAPTYVGAVAPAGAAPPARPTPPARPALPARKVRRVTPPPTRGTLRSLVDSLMVLPPPPGGTPDVVSASLRESSLACAPDAVKRASCGTPRKSGLPAAPHPSYPPPSPSHCRSHH